jgi:hypothetical protein
MFRRALVGVCLLTLVGCGSTVGNRPAQNAAGGNELSAASPQRIDGGLAAGTATGSAGAASSNPTASGSAGATSATTARTATGNGAATATLPKTGKGWDATTVYIGVTTQKDVQSAASSVGIKGLDGGDQEGEANAIAAELNRRGGLFGRQLKIAFHDVSTVATAQDPNSAGAATCTYFTQDRPVIAVVNPVTLMDVPSFRGCLANAKVPLFSASLAAVDTKVGAALAPYFYQSISPAWDALAPVFVSELQAQGWFTGWNPATGTALAGKQVKVGILTGIDDIAKRVGVIVKQALAGAGSTDAVTYEAAGGDYSSAVLQFNGKGVTHVISIDPSLLGFQLAASTQGYRPRYGITSFNGPQALLEGSSPQGQNAGALGVGWSPSVDVSDGHDPGPTGPTETECLTMLAKAGQTFAGRRLAEAVAFAFCDAFRLLAQAAVAGNGLTGPAIFQGVKQVAPTFGTAFSFASGLNATRLFVPGAVRRLAFDSGCSCFAYTSNTNRKI